MFIDMKLRATTQIILLNSICLLYVVLFIYAAVSKLLDFEQFRLQLGQSPLLSAFAGWASVGVPTVELFISLLLIFPKFRLAGLFASLSLMVMFTTYIIIILYFSAFIPCSCGGILEKMSWAQHLVFNVGFIVLAIFGLFVSEQSVNVDVNSVQNEPVNFLFLFKKRDALILFICFLFSVSLVVLLYALSEHSIHRNNSFLRRYPHHPVSLLHGLPITYNSYYIAGVANDRIYLGNVTAPLHLLSIDTSLHDVKPIRLRLERRHNYTFSAVQIRINAPYFYLIDGTVPIIFKGTISEWFGRPLVKEKKYFSLLEPMDSNHFALRSMNPFTNEYVLGTLFTNDSFHLKLAPHLLQKQVDGTFDTDGMLTYNKQLQQLIYVYYYRNAFVVADRNLQTVYRGKTIDTVSHASIKVAYLHTKKEKKLAIQPPMIQLFSTSAGKYLFAISNRLGRYEPEAMLKDASIVDVYNLQKQTYEFSFYLYNYKNEKVKSFKVYGNLLIALTEHYIVTYKLKANSFDFTLQD
jgi:uncharacterized membrane protein YphA (DoxX/SURF4 family)